MEENKIINTVICQLWREYEKGWDSRPDGFSLHLNLEDWKKFVDGYNKVFNSEEEAPDEYSKTDGMPYIAVVNDNIYDQVLSNQAKEDIDFEFRKFGKFFAGNAPRINLSLE